MRLILVLAGGFGFVAALIGGLVADQSPEATLVHGIVSALVAAVLLRWWMRIWISSLERVSRDEEKAARDRSQL